MEKLYNFILDTLNKAIKLLLTFLCLGVIIQLLINDELLNWDPVGNIQDAGPSFIGVISLVVLYILFSKKCQFFMGFSGLFSSSTHYIITTDLIICFY